MSRLTIKYCRLPATPLGGPDGAALEPALRSAAAHTSTFHYAFRDDITACPHTPHFDDGPPPISPPMLAADMRIAIAPRKGIKARCCRRRTRRAASVAAMIALPRHFAGGARKGHIVASEYTLSCCSASRFSASFTAKRHARLFRLPHGLALHRSRYTPHAYQHECLP